MALVPDRIALAWVRATAASIQPQFLAAGTSIQMEIGNYEVPIVLRAAAASDRSTAYVAEGMVSNPVGVPARIHDVSSVSEVHPVDDLRLPRPVEDGRPHARGVHAVDPHAGGIHGLTSAATDSATTRPRD